jgi:haloacetate dehalogenase
MIPGFEYRDIASAAGVSIHTAFAGSGPPVLLLHGYPENHLCWRKVAPLLVEAGFSVVVPDLRGYGDSGKPDSDRAHEVYSKRATAQDKVDVMRALGHTRFAVAGHDRGGRVSHRLALDHADAVTKLAVLDIAPTATMYAKTDRAFAQAYYHWFFMIQRYPIPEKLIGANAEWYIRHMLGVLDGPSAWLDAETAADYVRCYSDPKTLHAMCEDYRASASIDLKHDAADDAAGRKIQAPMLALWSGTRWVGRGYDVLSTWREKAHDVRGEAMDGGHFLPEEKPKETAETLIAFFKS